MDILTAVCQVLGKNPADYEINFAYVRPHQIRTLNKKFRQIDRVTDVLSFPDGDVNPETGRVFLGDVLICRPVARRQARQLGQSTEREITFLMVHGTLHLFGFDHLTPADEEKMLVRQREIMALLDDGFCA